MSTPTCFSSIQACAIRVAKLSSTGAPDDGASNGYVSSAFTKVDFTLNYEKGDEITVKTACGDICTSFTGDDHVKNGSLGIDFCQLDSQILSLITGSEAFSSGGNVIGLQVPPASGATTVYTSLEVWTKAWDNTAQAVPAFTSPNAAYFHMVWPKVRWSFGQLTMDGNAMVVPVTGVAEENDHITANGPFDDWPAPIVGRGGITSVFGFWLDDDLPSASCSYVSVSSLAS